MTICVGLAFLAVGTPQGTFTEVKGAYRVHLEAKPFDPKRYRKSDYKLVGGEPYLKGVRAWGHEPRSSGTPLELGAFRTELSKLRVWHRGKELAVPKRLVRGCFNVLSSNNDRPVTLSAAKDGIDIRLRGADGAASYEVVFHIRSNGRHWRTFRALA
jgi:hypothetical protein